jgi:hypothetical protein
MQKSKYLFPLVVVILAILLRYLSVFADEQTKKALIGDGWRLVLADAVLTKEVGNVVTGGLHASPGNSILILYFNVKYTKEAKLVESVENLIAKKAIIVDAGTNRAITCLSVKKIKSSFSTERGKQRDFETEYISSPVIQTSTKKGQVTNIYYTACVTGNNKNLLFVLPNLGKFELATSIQERESLWQGPLPDSTLYLEKSKD